MNGGQTQIAEALRLARTGDLDAAERICKDLIGRDASNAGAVMLLGIITASRGDNELAAPLFERVIALQPKRADAHFNLGLLRARQGRDADALVGFERALQLDPANIEAAVARADSLLALSRWRDAIRALDLILARLPNVADLWLKRGAALDTLMDAGAALESYRRAEKLDPNNPLTHDLIGAILARTGRYREAIRSFSSALAKGLQKSDTYLQRALAYSRLGDTGSAIEDFARAHELAPANRRVLIYFTECLHRLGRGVEAEALLRHAEAHDPVGSKILMGNSLSDMRRDAEAQAAFEEAVALDRSDFLAVWARTLHNLRLGDLEAGFRDFDSRLRGPLGDPARLLPEPEWQPGAGQSDRRLFLYTEQGFGDTIHFARYVPILIGRGHEVVLQVQPPLAVLCRSLHPDLTVISGTQPVPPFDARAPLLSLAARLGTQVATVPAHVPYLHATSSAVAAWQSRLANIKHPRVGVCWSGSLTHERDAVRSIRFAEFKGILAIDGISFVSLQRDVRPDEKTAVFAEAALPT